LDGEGEELGPEGVGVHADLEVDPARGLGLPLGGSWVAFQQLQNLLLHRAADAARVGGVRSQ
jgi:hypothetical protein